MRKRIPVLRRGERADYYRCQKMWYWRWRKGLVLKAKQFGALEFGTWAHNALALWYQKGFKRTESLSTNFAAYALVAIQKAIQNGAPDHVIEKAEELLSLGEEVMRAYQDFYGNDPKINVIDAELPLEFTISDSNQHLLAVHKLKPDLVFRDQRGRVWLMEHKTAKSIRTDHLPIDNQARPYGVMAEPALRKLGIIRRSEEFAGILYNFLRKGLPDLRPKNSKGQALNKDGAVSKSQPAPLFFRKPILMTRKAKIITLRRIQADAIKLTRATELVRSGQVKPIDIPKVPHYSCPRMCPFFTMCVAEEEGTDIRIMERTLYIRRDPYLYEEETTDERLGFEMG